MTLLKTDFYDLHSEITQAKDLTDTALETCKSDFNVKNQGVNHTISDMNSIVAENQTDLKEHSNKVETDIDNGKVIVL